jgi:hypothetical protein
MSILNELLEADSQPLDWYGWATNQAGHAICVGVPMAMAAMALGVPLVATPAVVAVIYLMVWEILIQRSLEVIDTVADSVLVGCGAGIAAGLTQGLWTGFLLWLVFMVALAIGVWRRL